MTKRATFIETRRGFGSMIDMDDAELRREIAELERRDTLTQVEAEHLDNLREHARVRQLSSTGPKESPMTNPTDMFPDELRARANELRNFERLTRPQAAELAECEKLIERNDRRRAEIMRAAENPNAVEFGGDPNSEAGHRFAAERAAHTPETTKTPTRAGHPFAVDGVHLRQHWTAIEKGESFAVREEIRAAVTTGAYGSPASWSSGSAPAGLPLRRFANIQIADLRGMSASHPSLTLPAGAAGAAEGSLSGEYDAVVSETLNTSRYGRWTQVTAAVRRFDDLSAINRAHSIGIARDLTLADVGVIEGQAGTATVYSSTAFAQNLREAVLTVAENVGVGPADLVVVGNAAALAVASAYAPTNGADVGSVVERLFGARVFPTAAATASQLTVFAPAAFIAFETPVASATVLDPKDGSSTFGSWLHATPAGPSIVGGAAAVMTA